MTYARDTDVSTEASRTEIERTLRKYGATRFGYVDEGDHAKVAFALKERQYRFTLPYPAFKTFETSPTGRARTHAAQSTAYWQAIRSRWRALALVIKAKLEAVETGIVSLEDEFLANTVTMTGKTVAEEIQPIIAEQYRLGPAHARPLALEGPKAA